MMWKVTDKGYKQCHTQQRAYTTSSAMSFIFICRKCKRPADLTVLLILYFIYLAKSIKVFTVLFYRQNESLHSSTAARQTAARFWFIGADFSERADEIINSHMHTPSQHCCSVTKGAKDFWSSAKVDIPPAIVPRPKSLKLPLFPVPMLGLNFNSSSLLFLNALRCWPVLDGDSISALESTSTDVPNKVAS